MKAKLRSGAIGAPVPGTSTQPTRMSSAVWVPNRSATVPSSAGSQAGMPAASAMTQRPSSATAATLPAGAAATGLEVRPKRPMPNILTKVAKATAAVSASPAPAIESVSLPPSVERWNPWKMVWKTYHSLTKPACGGMAARLMAANSAPRPNGHALRDKRSVWTME